MQKACSTSAESGNIWDSLAFPKVSKAVGTRDIFPQHLLNMML